MVFALPLAWLQLKKGKVRLAVALAGVSFAVILIFMQLGFRRALFDSATRYLAALDYDLVLINPETNFIAQPESFSRRRLYQAAGFSGVESVSPVYLGISIWKNPIDHSTRSIFVLGFNPANSVLEVEGVTTHLRKLQLPDAVLFDELSRPEYGPIADRVRTGEFIEVELGNRRINVRGLFEMGTSFGIDGSIITSDLNFLRLFPDRPKGLIDLGLIKLEPGVRPEALRNAIDAALPGDVLVLTKQEYIAQEIDYWDTSTPIGYVFAFGVIVGLVVGAIIVYQILFADVSEHLPEYATLRAMGYGMSYLVGVVLQESVILAVLGYVPGFLISLLLYQVAASATRLPLGMSLERGLAVLTLTVGMCAVSALMAVRKMRSADPAEIF